jgi:hypothetical protein
VAAELTRFTGQPVAIMPVKADNTISLGVKKAALWDVLELLSASGKIRIGGESFENRKHTEGIGERRENK